MKTKARIVSAQELACQNGYIDEIRALNEEFLSLNGRRRRAVIDTYGCQQNVADSEKIAGMLEKMGYEITSDQKGADLILLNTCAVREHAELRVLGNVGALSHLKRKNPGLVLAMCGCMVQQEHIKEKIRRSYPYVDIVFGTHALWRFPQLLREKLLHSKRVFDISGDEAGKIAEDIPIRRDGKVKAWLSIMYGCNNFCSYCIVPYVRGRERSRAPEKIEEEFRALVREGYKDIMLLGQNVNSYGKDLDAGIDFSDLLRRLNDVPGEFVIRFMTSHPKDATKKLIDTIAECAKVERHLHLPFQSGSDTILRRMNRVYTREQYLALVAYAKEKIDGLVLTSDVIVGFPNERAEDFEDTMTLVEAVGFDALFTFIYSKRSGTPAAEMEDPVTDEEKHARFDRLLELQNAISERQHAQYVGTTVRVLVDGEGREAGVLSARTSGGRLVHLKSSEKSLIGSFIDARITGSNTWALLGECANRAEAERE